MRLPVQRIRALTESVRSLAAHPIGKRPPSGSLETTWRIAISAYRRRFRIQLLLMVLLLSLVPLVVVTDLSLQQVRSWLIQGVLTDMRVVSSGYSSSLNLYIQDRIKRASQLAGDERVSAKLEGQSAQSTLATNDIDLLLNAAQSNYDYNIAVSLLTMNNKVVDSTDSSLVGQTATFPKMSGAIDLLPITSAVLNHPHFDVVSKVTGATPQQIGWVWFAVDPSQLQVILTESLRNRKGHVLLVDESGRVLADSSWGSNPPIGTPLATLDPGFAERLRRARFSSSDGSAQVTYNGDVYYIFQSKIAQKPWTIYVEDAESDILQPLDSLRRTIMAMVAFVGLIVFGIVTFYVRSIIAVIRDLEEAADKISVGDIRQEVGTSREDEFGRMAEKFNEMVAYLNSAAAAADLLATGDLRVDVRPRSEDDVFGKAFAGMSANWRTVISQLSAMAPDLVGAATELNTFGDRTARDMVEVTTNVSEVSTAQEQVSSESMDLAVRVNTVNQLIGHIDAAATAQSEAVQSTFEALGTLNENMAKVVDHVRVLTETAMQTRDAATYGATAVHQTRQGMEDIQKVMSEAMGKFQLVTTNVLQMSDITRTIGHLTKSLHVLALNVSIESVRLANTEQAAVLLPIAREVQNMARLSVTDSKLIYNLVEDVRVSLEQLQDALGNTNQVIQRHIENADLAQKRILTIVDFTRRMHAETNGIAAFIDDVVALVNDVRNVSDTLNRTIRATKGDVQRVVNESNAIATVADTNAALAEEVTAAMNQVAETCAEVAHRMEGLRAISLNLRESSREILEKVQTFKVTDALEAGDLPTERQA